MKRMIYSAVIVGMALSAQAQDFTIDDMGKADPMRLRAGTYSLDTHHSHIVFDVDHFGISRYIGLVGGLSGTLKLDPNHPSEAQVEINIPIAGIVSTNAPLDTHLKTSDFFDVERFPNAAFRSTSLKVHGNDAEISGLLTIRGITKPVELRTKLVGAGINPISTLLNVGFEATTQIKRSEFGVSHYVPFVSDEVQLRISVVFEATD